MVLIYGAGSYLSPLISPGCLPPPCSQVNYLADAHPGAIRRGWTFNLGGEIRGLESKQGNATRGARHRVALRDVRPVRGVGTEPD